MRRSLQIGHQSYRCGARSRRWLEKAYEGRVGLLVYARVDSVWDDLRPDPQFQHLIRRLGMTR